MGKRELVSLLNLSSWYLVMVERLFLAVPWGCLRLVIVVFPDRTHLLFLNKIGRGPLGDATYQISMLYVLWLQSRRLFRVFPI